MYDDSAIRHAFRFVKKLRGNAVRFSFDLMPEIWYRIADEEGILVQNEAHWHLNETATLEAVTAEFTDWIHEHANHPSVVIWDAANETANTKQGGPLLREVVKAVRHLDLSNRPWEPSTWFPHTQEAAVLSQKGDVTEWHPYSVFDYLGDGRWKWDQFDGLYPEIFEKGPDPKPVHPGWIVNEYCGLFLNRDGSFYLEQSQRFTDAYFAEANGSHYLFGRARFVAWEAEYYRRLPGCLGVLWNSYLWGPGIQQPLASQTLSEKELALGRYIADASAPVGVMVNNWKTKLPTGRVKVSVSVANDGPTPWSGTVRLSLIRAGKNLSKMGALFEPPGGESAINKQTVRQWQKNLNKVPVSQQGEAVFDVVIPEAGNYHFMAEVTGLDGQPVRSWRDFVSTAQPSAQTARAAFFVGGDGASDSNPGTASAPFATIQAAANVAQPGDVVKIRDGIYRETVVPANSGLPSQPIVFEADDGAEPVISGANLLTGANWQPTQRAIQVPGNHIYEATVSLPVTGYAEQSTGNTDLLANQIFVRSKMMPEARWPKMVDTDDPMNHSGMRMRPGPRSVTGWGITFGSGSRPTNTLSDPEIPTIPGGWAGGRIKMYTKYLPNDNPIVSSAPGQISWQPHDIDSDHQILTKQYSDHGSFNYHLFGVLGALSAENEWFYDGTKLYLWAPGGGVPADVEYKARNHGFNLTGRSHITLKGLNFFACEIPTNGNSIWPSNASNWPGVVNNDAHPTTGVVPTLSNNIIIDTCRFKQGHRLLRVRQRLQRASGLGQRAGLPEHAGRARLSLLVAGGRLAERASGTASKRFRRLERYQRGMGGAHQPQERSGTRLTAVH